MELNNAVVLLSILSCKPDSLLFLTYRRGLSNPDQLFWSLSEKIIQPRLRLQGEMLDIQTLCHEMRENVLTSFQYIFVRSLQYKIIHEYVLN